MMKRMSNRTHPVKVAQPPIRPNFPGIAVKSHSRVNKIKNHFVIIWAYDVYIIILLLLLQNKYYIIFLNKLTNSGMCSVRCIRCYLICNVNSCEKKINRDDHHMHSFQLTKFKYGNWWDALWYEVRSERQSSFRTVCEDRRDGRAVERWPIHAFWAR